MTPKLRRLFKKMPPKKPIMSLNDVVDDWMYRFRGPEARLRDLVIEHVSNSKSLKEAIERACWSRNALGKKYNHQSKVPNKILLKFASIIKRNINIVRKLKNFDELHDLLERIKPWGIGPVTTYDVAARIAAYKKLKITTLYLHAGVLQGWKALGGKVPKDRRVKRAALPAPLKRFPDTDEVEDMLCAYRGLFKRGWI